MGAKQPAKAKLWLEGWRAFLGSWRELIKWAVCFLIVLVPIEFWFLSEYGPYNAAIIAILKTHSSDIAQQMKNIPKPSQLPLLIMFPAYIVFAYFLNIIYLRRAPIVTVPEARVGNFLYAAIKGFLK